MGSEQSVNVVVREVYEPCCEPGATVPYRELQLTKLEWPEKPHSLWEVIRDGETVDTVDTERFRSARHLQQWLDALVDCDPVREQYCETCPLAPGD